MAWNTEETKRKLRDAAVAEFAQHGLGGTNMERIARRAGVNKERLYTYYGDKRQLFSTVLADELHKVAAAVPLDHLDGPAAVGVYAGAVFDYHARHPELTRLLLWEGLLDQPAVPDEASRSEYYRGKVEAFRAAQRSGVIDARLPAADLAFLILALAGWWYAVPQMARMTHLGPDGPGNPGGTGGTGDPGGTGDGARAARESVVRAAIILATPG